jgi:hypothetical protein
MLPPPPDKTQQKGPAMTTDINGWFRKNATSKKIEFVSGPRQGEPVLLRAQFYSRTGDDNKDHDTGVWVTVKNQNNQILLAHCDNADNSSSDSTEYNDHSEHIIELTVDSPGAPRSECEHFNVHLSITTNGNDTWKIEEARLTLLFSDGLTLVATETGFQLKNNGASTDFSNAGKSDVARAR